MRVQTEEWRRFIPGVRMYKGKMTYFYNGEKLSGDEKEYLVYDREERQKWEVIVVLPGVEIIPEYTFRSCKNVKTVIMSDSAKRIEVWAFSDCYSLKFVKLSKNIDYIGEWAFCKCHSLTSIFIPQSCREIGRDAFLRCYKLIIVRVPRHISLGYNVIGKTALMKQFQSCKSPTSEVNEWIKQSLDDYLLHKLCCRDWFKKDDCNLTPIDYFIEEGEHIAYLPEYVQYLIKNKRLHELKELSSEEIVEKQYAWQKEQIISLQSQLAEQKHEQLHEKKGLSSDENLEKQCALQKEQIISLQSQVAKQKHELDSLKKDKDCIMSVSLLEEEIKCFLCCNKFSTDLNSTLPEIRKFLPVLSRAACPHYFCQGCVEKSQLAAAENAPQKKVPKWLKCMVCKRKTAFCPEDPFYHTKLIQLLDRARRFHPIDVKVEEGHDAAETHSNSKDNRPSKRAKVANVAIKEES